MTLKRRLSRVEHLAGHTDGHDPLVIIVGFGKDNPMPGQAIFVFGPLQGRSIDPEADETYEMFSARASRMNALGREMSRKEFLEELEGGK